MNLDVTKVTKIYLGRDRVCRCGCAGEYVNRGTPKFDSRLKRFAKLWCDYAPQKDDVLENEYLNVSYGKDRAMTVYFG